jgi:hypothetical protein
MFTIQNFVSAAAMDQAAIPYMQPELLDKAVDRKHRLYLSVVLGETLGCLGARTSRQLMSISALDSYV